MDKLATLREAIGLYEDPFKDGEIIRWLSAGTYMYSANRAGGKWYISGTANFYGQGTHNGIEYSRLVRILSRSDVSDIRTVVEWSEPLKASGLTEKKIKKNSKGAQERRRAAKMTGSRSSLRNLGTFVGPFPGVE